jgi:hypothetical protein
MLAIDSLQEWRLATTVDGTTGGDWAGNATTIIDTNTTRPTDVGQSIVFRNSIFWVHEHFTGTSKTGSITQYDFVLNTLTRYNVSTIINTSNQACSYALHVHDNVLFLFCWATQGDQTYARLTKLQAGSFQTVITDTSQRGGNANSEFGHAAMFTDQASGDLIIFEPGKVVGALLDRARVIRVQNATGAASFLDISSTVMGAIEGADKYLQGGGSADHNRRWAVNVDAKSDPANPRTFLTTWVPGGVTETWEWKGVGAEIEAVALLAGISDDFALPYNTVGGGERNPRIAAVEIGDISNAPSETVGGTRFYFRGRGSAPVGIITFYGNDDEITPTIVVPIVSGSLVVESGSPPTTPTISGNTIINFTPDNGVVLYSVILDVGAAGVDIGEGDIGLIIPDFG